MVYSFFYLIDYCECVCYNGELLFVDEFVNVFEFVESVWKDMGGEFIILIYFEFGILVVMKMM